MINSEVTAYDARKKIFSVAARLFADKGYNAVSMREISEQAELSKPTIYYYFGSKEGIYKELVTTGFSHMHSVLENIVPLKVTVSEKLNLILKKYFNFSQNYPEFTKFISNLIYSAEKMEFLISFKKEAEQKEELITGLFREGIQTGEFTPSLNPDIATHVFFGVLMRYIMIQHESNDMILSDELADNILSTLICGMRKE